MKIFRLILVLVIFMAGLSLQKVSALELVPDFPHGRLLEQKQFVDHDYRLVLSAPKRINNELRFEKKMYIDTSGYARLLEAESGYDINEVLRYYVTRLEGLKGRILFQCKGRDCGDSNTWANKILKQSKMLGRDQNQRYLVSEIRYKQKEYFVVLYASMTFTRKVYVFLQVLDKPESKKIDLPIWGDQTGFGFNGSVLDEKTANQIVNRLPKGQSGELWVIAHTNYAAGMKPQDVIVASRRIAEKIALVLKDKLNSEDRQHSTGSVVVKYFGAGPFAWKPEAISEKSWFELYFFPD